jgi:hypothetical protein
MCRPDFTGNSEQGRRQAASVLMCMVLQLGIGCLIVSDLCAAPTNVRILSWLDLLFLILYPLGLTIKKNVFYSSLLSRPGYLTNKN